MAQPTALSSVRYEIQNVELLRVPIRLEELHAMKSTRGEVLSAYFPLFPEEKSLASNSTAQIDGSSEPALDQGNTGLFDRSRPSFPIS